MRLLFISFFALVTSIVGASAQSLSGPMTMPSAPAAKPSRAPSPAPSPSLVVHMKDFAYAPEPAAVIVGQTIEFVNDDESAHTVTADDASFDSGYLAKGDTWSYTFTKAGTIPYYCIYHRFMRGTIVVRAK